MYSLLRISCRTAARRAVVQAPRRYLSEGTAAGGGGDGEEKGGAGAIRQRLEGLVKKDKVVVFIKGTPAQPMCGFSNAVVQILRMHGVEEYGSYNVLEDQEIRQGGLKRLGFPKIFSLLIPLTPGSPSSSFSALLPWFGCFGYLDY